MLSDFCSVLKHRLIYALMCVFGVTPRNRKNCTQSRGAKTTPAFKTDFTSWSSVQEWPKTKNFGPCLWLRQYLLKSPSFEGFTTGRFLPPQFQHLTYDLFRSEECPQPEQGAAPDVFPTR